MGVFLCAFLWVFAAASSVAAGPAEPATAAAAHRAYTNYTALHQEMQSGTNSTDLLRAFGSACFDVAYISTNNTERAEVAEQGIAACRTAVEREPDNAAGHYYLAMNIGQLADTKRNLSALRMVKEMEREFKTALRLDPDLDHAGPARGLALLYMQAPSFASIGSRSKSREHFRLAVATAPDYPENRLCYIEALLKWGDTSDAREQYDELERRLPEAREKFAGEEYAADWVDWTERLTLAKIRLGEPASRVLESPHHGE